MLTETTILYKAKLLLISTITVISAVLVYLGINPINFYLLGLLVSLDIATGIWKGFALKTLASRKGHTGIIKKLFLLVLILMLGILGKIQGESIELILPTIILIAATIEVISITGNVISIYEKQEVKEIDAVALLYNEVLCKFKDKLLRILGDNKYDK
jgi:phage-related holin